MLDNLILQLKNLSERIPIGPFVLIGGFIEEIVAPIPSPLLMTVVGSMVQVQGTGVIMLVSASVLAAIGKTVGSWLIYVVSDKAEDVVMRKFGKWLGVTHKDIESIGKYFDKSWKDDLLLIILRAFPLIPGAPVAVVCGIIKLSPKTYVFATFVGTFLRSLLFGFVGYGGVANYQVLIDSVNAFETAGKIVFVIAVLGFGVWVYYLRKHGGVQAWIQKRFRRNRVNHKDNTSL